MHQAVRCPHCDELSRVPSAALGQYVACPNCRQPFNAVAEELPPEPRRNVPTVYPAKTSVPVVHPAGWGEHDTPPAAGPRSVLFGLALLPFVIPLLWILGPTLTGKDAVFTFALPMAMAAAASALCLGVVLAADWSFGTRVKAILALVLVMHFAAAFLYFLKAEWVEAVRNWGGRGPVGAWRPFTPPDKSYQALMPGPAADDDRPLFRGWDLQGYRSSGQQSAATYAVARGRPPAALDNQPNEKFFDEAKEQALAAAGATLSSERAVRHGEQSGREYVLLLPAANSRRVLRVFRTDGFVFAAAVEDVFLTADQKDVRYFFDHIKLPPKR